MKKIEITNEEKQIIETLKKHLWYNAPYITQERFDNLVDYVMSYETGGNPKELIWRLCGCYDGFNFNKVIDIFVDSKEYYYTSELVCFVRGNLDQEYLVNKLIDTNDLDFINKTVTSGDNAMIKFMHDKYMDKLRKFYIKNK